MVTIGANGTNGIVPVKEPKSTKPEKLCRPTAKKIDEYTGSSPTSTNPVVGLLFLFFCFLFRKLIL